MRISIKRGSLTSKLHATYASTGRVACRNNLELHGSSYLPSTGSDDRLLLESSDSIPTRLCKLVRNAWSDSSMETLEQ